MKARCSQCGIEFQRVRSSRTYCSARCREHAVGQVVQSCRVCGEEFRRDRDMKDPICSPECRHKPKVCQHCGEQFTNRRCKTRKYCGQKCAQMASRVPRKMCKWCETRPVNYNTNQYCSPKCWHTKSRFKNRIAGIQKAYRSQLRPPSSKRVRLDAVWGRGVYRAMAGLRSRSKARRGPQNEDEQWLLAISTRLAAMRYRTSAQLKQSPGSEPPTIRTAITKAIGQIKSKRARKENPWLSKCINRCSNMRKRRRRIQERERQRRMSATNS